MAPRSRRFGEPELRAALGGVEEPVLELPIGDLGMVREVGLTKGAATVGLALGPRRDDLLSGLLARALDRLGPEEASALADAVGFQYGEELAARMGPTDGHRSARTAMAAVADALTAHGFAAHVGSGGPGLTIVSECCPFGEAAQLYPHVVCAMDRGMIRGMLAGLYGATEPRFEASRPDGDDHCVARV